MNTEYTFTPAMIKKFVASEKANYTLLIQAVKLTKKAGINGTNSAMVIRSNWGTCPDTAIVTKCWSLLDNKASTVKSIVHDLTVCREERNKASKKSKGSKGSKGSKDKGSKGSKGKEGKEDKEEPNVPAIALVNLVPMLELALLAENEGDLRKSISALISRFTIGPIKVKKTTKQTTKKTNKKA